MHSNEMESANYNPFDDLIELFDTPGSLSELPELLSYTHRFKLSIEKEIESERDAYTRFQQNKDTDLDSLTQELESLVSRVQETHSLANSTESVIDGMTGSIRSLDSCKKNLTLSMTIIKRLQMLVTAFESLEQLVDSKSRHYDEIYDLLSVVLQLTAHFQSYKSIDDINTLTRKVGGLKAKLVELVFEDFEKGADSANLVRACNILDTLGPSYHQKLSNWFISRQLKEVETIFNYEDEAGSIDNLGRRFVMLKRILGTVESKQSRVFPEEWQIPLGIAQRFCELTKNDLKVVLARDQRISGDRVDIKLLMTCLTEVLSFESYLNGKFDDAFANSIASVFEPYLSLWVQYQDRQIEEKFIQFLNPDMLLKKTGGEDSENAVNVLESSTDLFRSFRHLLNQLSKLSQGEPLAKLALLFTKYLAQYNTRILRSILPDEGQLRKCPPQDVEYMCLVLNTADYCSITSKQLQLKLESITGKPAYNDQFDLCIDGYVALINDCVNGMLFKIEQEASLCWREMENVNWKHLEGIAESRYVSYLKQVLDDYTSIILPNLNRKIYAKSFVNKLVELIINDFTAEVVKLRPISEIASEQLLLDLSNIKVVLSNGHGDKAILNNNVTSVERVLKILLVNPEPLESFISNYFLVIQDSNFSNFLKILTLKGLESDRRRDLEVFRRCLENYQKETPDSNHPQLQASFEFLENITLEKESPVTPVAQSGPSFANFFHHNASPASPTMNTLNNFTKRLKGPDIAVSRESFEKNLIKTFGNDDDGLNLNQIGRFFSKKKG